MKLVTSATVTTLVTSTAAHAHSGEHASTALAYLTHVWSHVDHWGPIAAGGIIAAVLLYRLSQPVRKKVRTRA